MKKAALGLAGLVLCMSSAEAQTQKVTVYDPSRYILVDGSFLRGSLGYTTFAIGDVDTLPDREGSGLDLRIESRIVSAIIEKDEGFVISDAFFLNLTMGSLSSEPLSYYKDPESRFSTAMKFGYSFLAGYSGERFGVLGGKSFEWFSSFVGGSSLPGEKLMVGSAPWMMRLELRPAFSKEFRIMLTGWDNFKEERMNKGFRVDIPFLPEKRFFITYAFCRIGADVAYATFDNNVYAPGTFTQHMIGLRFGSIY